MHTTAKGLLKLLRDAGFSVSYRTVLYSIEEQLIPDTERDDSGRRIYTTKHFEAMVRLLQKRAADQAGIHGETDSLATEPERRVSR